MDGHKFQLMDKVIVKDYGGAIPYFDRGLEDVPEWARDKYMDGWYPETGYTGTVVAYCKPHRGRNTCAVLDLFHLFFIEEQDLALCGGV